MEVISGGLRRGRPTKWLSTVPANGSCPRDEEDAELGDVPERRVDELLDAGIAAWAAYRPMPVRVRVRRRTPAPYRVWVDTWMHALAEDVTSRQLRRRRL
jgi:hypothetical protein